VSKSSGTRERERPEENLIRWGHEGTKHASLENEAPLTEGESQRSKNSIPAIRK